MINLGLNYSPIDWYNLSSIHLYNLSSIHLPLSSDTALHTISIWPKSTKNYADIAFYIFELIYYRLWCKRRFFNFDISCCRPQRVVLIILESDSYKSFIDFLFMVLIEIQFTIITYNTYNLYTKLSRKFCWNFTIDYRNLVLRKLNNQQRHVANSGSRHAYN